MTKEERRKRNRRGKIEGREKDERTKTEGRKSKGRVTKELGNSDEGAKRAER